MRIFRMWMARRTIFPTARAKNNLAVIAASSVQHAMQFNTSPYHILKKSLVAWSYGNSDSKKMLSQLPIYVRSAINVRKKIAEKPDDQIINAENMIKIYENIHDTHQVFSAKKMYLASRLVQLDSFVGAYNTIIVPDYHAGTTIDTETMIELTQTHIKQMLANLPLQYDAKFLYSDILRVDKEIKSSNAKSPNKYSR